MISERRSPARIRFRKLNSVTVKFTNGVCYYCTIIATVFKCYNIRTASLLSGYNTIIGERLIKEKCKEERIGKIKSIDRYSV